MAEEAIPKWSALSTQARGAFEWAAASEVNSRMVGTRAVLIGILRSASGGTPAHDLLDYLSVSESVLFDELAKSYAARTLDPGISRQVTLKDFPTLTSHAKISLRRAESLRRGSRRTQLDVDCLFGGLLLGMGTARRGLSRFIDERLLDRIGDGYQAWLVEESSTFRDFLEVTLEADGVRSADPDSAPVATPDESQYRASSFVALANVRNDTDHSRDLIGVGPDARALAALLASKQLSPPLAFGLYGDWGSGKTFFMKQVEENIKQLASSEVSQDTFCANVAHIWFNAWHYAEGNLWASLLDHVFANLHGQEDAHQRALNDAIQTLSGAREMTEAAKASVAIAGKRVKVTKEALNEAVKRRGAALRTAAAVRAKDAWEAVKLTADDQGLVDEVKDAAAQLGVPAATDAARDLWRQSVQIGALSRRAMVLATTGRGWRSPLAVGLIAFFSVGAVSWVLTLLANSIDAWSGTVTLVVGQITTVVSAAAAWIGRQSALAKRMLAPSERLQARLEDRKRAIEVELEVEIARCAEELRAADAEQRSAQEALRAAQLDEVTAKAKQEHLTGTRLLRRYLKERVDSADYQQYLGVVALARRDLDDLQTFMRAAMDDTGSEGHLDRIILYIDDLDRCEPERVADVLDAIHLLLAMPLFVVIVGVSPRWLELSLEKRHPVLLGDSPDTSNSTSATDYLEKIFQLTYTLRPLDGQGAGQFLTGLARSATSITALARGVVTGDPRASGGAGLSVVDAQLARASHSVHLEPGADDVGLIPPDMLASALTMTNDEVSLLAAVAPLVSTSPRRAQRFLNLYMVLRARYQPGPDDYDGDALLMATALAMGVPASFAEVLNSGDVADDELPFPLALASRVRQGAHEERRWRQLQSLGRDTARLNDISVARLRAWVGPSWPYLPLPFQTALERRGSGHDQRQPQA